MSANQKESRVPLLLYPILIALVILYIVFTILTFGIFLPEGDKKKSGSKMTKNNSEEERIRIVLERKQNRLKTLVLRIAELEVIKRQITRKEKRILFGVRLIICIGLISFNWFYLNEIIQKSLNMKHIDQIIGSIADLNAIILLGYSLPAYLLYGTVGKSHLS